MMKPRRAYDLVIIGADAAGLAAAACAARRLPGSAKGAAPQVAVIRTGEEPAPGPSSPGVPDFVWRRLDLHLSGLALTPVSARVSLLDEGRRIRTHDDAGRTQDALAAAGDDSHILWADFVGEAARDARELGALVAASARGGEGVLSALTGANGAALAARLTAPCAHRLDDYFADPGLKAHVAAAALLPFALGGDEAGSALALASLHDQASWRVRAGAKGPSLLDALEDACRAADVEGIPGRVRAIESGEDGRATIILDDGDTLRTKTVMASRSDLPTALRLGLRPSASPLARPEGARAEVRVRFAHPPEPPGGDRGAVYYAAASLEELAAARDAAQEGRIPEKPPIMFEFQGDEILVLAPYLPAALYTDDEPRDWSEQDRQALGQTIVERLRGVLNGAPGPTRRVDVRIVSSGPRRSAVEGEGVIFAPPPAHSEIAAAARLAMELVARE